MPTINIDMRDLKRLVGIELEDDKILETLSALKCEPVEVIGEKITLEVTSDRPDFFSCEGISRGVRIYHGGSGAEYRYSRLSPVQIYVDPSTAEVRPYIVSAVLLGVELDEEGLVQIMQLQEKLHTTYCSNRRKGSIGIYDLDKVTPPLTYVALPPNEIRFSPLGYSEAMDGATILEKTPKGIEYAWILKGKSRYPLLRDSKNRVLSMPPIINSEDTKVTEDTRNIIIDVTGMDERTINLCLNILTTSVMERGGSLQSVEVLYGNRTIRTPKLDAQCMSLKLSTVKEVSGLDLRSEEVISLLKRMGHEAKEKGEGEFEVYTPPYRADILHEVDQVEDIVIAIGLNNITPEAPKVATIGRAIRGSKARKRIRDLMVGMGFQEVTTYLLSNRSVLEEKPLMEKRALVELINPVSSEYAVLRDCILPKLLQFLSQNTHYSYPQKIFEYGDVVTIDGSLAKVKTHLAAAIADHRVSYEEIQAVAAALFRNISRPIWFEPLSGYPFIPGRVAKIITDGREIGCVGEISPQVLVNFGLECPVGALECDLSELLQG
ncbi:MAG: phenylalanine--tRNA ligase subunit beta [Candidatus Methanomethylicaceae archaeon]